MSDQVHCELHGLQDGTCIVCARLDLNGMRDFQFKYIKADQELEKLRKLLDDLRKYTTGTAYLTPMRIKDLLHKYGF